MGGPGGRAVAGRAVGYRSRVQGYGGGTRVEHERTVLIDEGGPDARAAQGAGPLPMTGAGATRVTCASVLRSRVHAQQLDRAPAAQRLATDADVLDIGVRESGPGGVAWALVNRAVDVDGARGRRLASDLAALDPATARSSDLWRTLGRPVVLAGSEVVGTWRPRASGRRLRIQLDPWIAGGAPLRDAVAEHSARPAEHRGLGLGAVAR